ncbi:MAG TPA: carotenoid biosynthesis protein, partial [Desulfuromonadaceae bacterium]|nr:carotenoid biosynthesis protein [Desulfuromonadaceae bacterium]
FGATGPKLFGVLPWAVPLLWIVALFNARGVSRLILRPWRKTRTYGFRLIGLTALLLAAFDFALEPFATRVKQFWFWPTTKVPISWQGTPVVDFASKIAVAVLILVFVTPLLINKQLSKRRPPDFHPVMIWAGALAMFAVGAGMQGLWVPVGVDAAIAVITLVFAIRGARW